MTEAITLEKSGNFVRARRCCEEALRMQPNCPGALLSRLMNYAAMTQIRVDLRSQKRSRQSTTCSGEDATLVRGNHVLDVDEGIFATMDFEDFQSFIDQVTKIQTLPLRVVNVVATVEAFVFEDVEDRKDLAIVRNKGFADHFACKDKRLEHFQCCCYDFSIPSVQCSLDGDDELRYHWKDLAATFIQHIVDALYSQEPIWVLLLSESVKKDREVMVIVQLLNVHLP